MYKQIYVHINDWIAKHKWFVVTKFNLLVTLLNNNLKHKFHHDNPRRYSINDIINDYSCINQTAASDKACNLIIYERWLFKPIIACQ